LSPDAKALDEGKQFDARRRQRIDRPLVCDPPDDDTGSLEFLQAF